MEKAKKMKCYKRLIYKRFVQVSGLLWRTVSEFFAETFHAPLLSFVWRRHIGVPSAHAQRQVCYQLQGKSLKLTEHSPSVFVTVTVDVLVRL